MSSQQSTLESVRDTASSAIETITNAVSTTPAGNQAPKEEDEVGKDSHGNKFKKGDFKDKLNEAAHGGPPQKEPSLMEKGRQFRFAVSDESVEFDLHVIAS
ncbi:hypothetical protein ACMFMG_007724 [Clarireedia jacksonii]